MATGLALALLGVQFWRASIGDTADLWHTIPVMSALSALFGMYIVRPLRLTLTETGFTVRKPIGPSRVVAWKDIDSLFPWRRLGHDVVGYRLRNGSGATDGVVGAALPVPAPRLLLMLQEWHARYG